MDKNNFVKFINNYEIHCEKLFPMREDPFKKHKEEKDVNANKVKNLLDRKNAKLDVSKTEESNIMSPADINNKKSIVKERQEMIIKNKDFLLTLFKKYVQIQDEEKDLDFYQIKQGKKRKYLSCGLIES